jgi:predicted TIM-barrel fold metal-dependent hydrolase
LPGWLSDIYNLKPRCFQERRRSMSDKQIIDVHCHLFNVQYAVMELAAASWNHLWGNYPHSKRAEERRGAREARGLLETLEGIKEFAAYIARLVEVALSDCAQNFDIAKRDFAESALKDSRLMVVPLMMDIYFSLDDNKDEEAAGLTGRRGESPPEVFAIPEEQKEEFENHFNDIVKLIREEVQKMPETSRRSTSGGKLEEVFNSAKEELLAPPGKGRRGDEYDGIEISPGYKKHMHDLEELCTKYPETVFPFLAVDPRRIGIMKLIDMKVDKGKGIFKGIKLYTPLGYLPTHRNLQPVYEYCNEHDIPITFHCSHGGMNNFRKKNYVSDWDGNGHMEDFSSTGGNKSIYYTDPGKWLLVLKRWPRLRVNFAHFGGGDSFASGDNGWMESIITLLGKYENAYADISYFSKPGLAQKVAELINGNDILTRRLMFGTDYVMVMMDSNLGGLKSYFDRFSALDRSLLIDNARAFLKF